MPLCHCHCTICHTIVTTATITVAPMQSPLLHHCSCHTAAVIRPLPPHHYIQMPYAAPLQLPVAPSQLLHHRHGHTIVAFHPLSSWQHGTARWLLKNWLLQCHHCANCHAAGGWQSNAISPFLLSCLWLIVAFCCPCPSWQQGTVRELLKYGYCNAATVPAAVLPGTEE